VFPSACAGEPRRKPGLPSDTPGGWHREVVGVRGHRSSLAPPDPRPESSRQAAESADPWPHRLPDTPPRRNGGRRCGCSVRGRRATLGGRTRRAIGEGLARYSRPPVTLGPPSIRGYGCGSKSAGRATRVNPKGDPSRRSRERCTLDPPPKLVIQVPEAGDRMHASELCRHGSLTVLRLAGRANQGLAWGAGEPWLL
jgi:hypothetical protein